MSFGITGPESTPLIQKAQNMQNNGGGGNLGYFQQGKKKKEEDDSSQDIFESSSESTDDFDLNEESVVDRLKKYWIEFKIIFKK